MTSDAATQAERALEAWARGYGVATLSVGEQRHLEDAYRAGRRDGEEQVRQLREAARDVLDRWEECLPVVQGAESMARAHGWTWHGPKGGMKPSFDALRAALEAEGPVRVSSPAPQSSEQVADVLAQSHEATRELREGERAAEVIPSGLMEMHLGKGMSQDETFAWLVERSRLAGEQEKHIAATVERIEEAARTASWNLQQCDHDCNDWNRARDRLNEIERLAAALDHGATQEGSEGEGAAQESRTGEG